jgi:hypothetical protein
MRNLALLLTFCAVQSFAQSTFTAVTGDVSWRNDASWTGTATFPTHDPISNSNYTIPVNSIVRLGSTSDPRNLTAGNASGGRTFTVNGTLIIYGNVDFSNQAADIRLGSGALLIVFGSITVDNQMDISSTGNIIATGGFTKQGAANQGSYTGGGNVYASPISVPGTWVPTADQKNNTTDLSNDLPNVFAFINCGGGPGCSLPITLSKFDGKVKSDNAVMLNWTTLAETDFSHFVVQRSQNGSNFQDLGQVYATGGNKTNIETTYSFEDTQPMIGLNYYRLKAIDLDETAEIFEAIVVNFKGISSITAFPNPSAGNAVSVKINFSPSEGDRLRIVDNMGVAIVDSPIDDHETEVIFEKPLNSGIYSVIYISQSGTKLTRLVVR